MYRSCTPCTTCCGTTTYFFWHLHSKVNPKVPAELRDFRGRVLKCASQGPCREYCVRPPESQPETSLHASLIFLLLAAGEGGGLAPEQPARQGCGTRPSCQLPQGDKAASAPWARSRGQSGTYTVSLYGRSHGRKAQPCVCGVFWRPSHCCAACGWSSLRSAFTFRHARCRADCNEPVQSASVYTCLRPSRGAWGIGPCWLCPA